MIFWNRILFVFVFGWFSQTEYYSYSYSGNFFNPNIIRIRIRVIFQPEYYSYSGDFLKPNSICICWDFSESYIYFAENSYFWWATCVGVGVQNMCLCVDRWYYHRGSMCVCVCGGEGVLWRLVLGYRPQKERYCVLANASSNCLLGDMQIGTGCICLSFLRYEFTNVSSKHSDHSRQNGIGCIDLTFLHCVLSNVISNFLNEQRKALLWVFKWFLKLPASKDA